MKSVVTRSSENSKNRATEIGICIEKAIEATQECVFEVATDLNRRGKFDGIDHIKVLEPEGTSSVEKGTRWRETRKVWKVFFR